MTLGNHAIPILSHVNPNQLLEAAMRCQSQNWTMHRLCKPRHQRFGDCSQLHRQVNLTPLLLYLLGELYHLPRQSVANLNLL
jgi:hypothetical protein